MLKPLRILGALWAAIGTGNLAHYSFRYFEGNLDGFSYGTGVLYDLLGLVVGLFLIGDVPGRRWMTAIAAIVYGLREFTYLFHASWQPTLSIETTISGFILLVAALSLFATASPKIWHELPASTGRA